MANYVARVTGDAHVTRFAEEVVSAQPIRRAQEYVGGRALNEEEQRIAGTFEALLAPAFGRPWRGPGAPAISSFILNDYIFFLTNVITGYYVDGHDPYAAVNGERLPQGVEFLKGRLQAETEFDQQPPQQAVQQLLVDVLYGNKFEGTRDFSEGPPVIPLDQSQELASAIMGLGPDGILDLYVDNLGPEFATWLRLAGHVTTHRLVGRIRLHLKAEPTVVSDVWGRPDDPRQPHLTQTLQVFKDSGEPQLQQLAQTIEGGLDAGVIELQRDEFLCRLPDFAQPEAMAQLHASTPDWPSSAATTSIASSLAIVAGRIPKITLRSVGSSVT
jgi:hypothetical protein